LVAPDDYDPDDEVWEFTLALLAGIAADHLNEV
jgi:hypothetical protein